MVVESLLRRWILFGAWLCVGGLSFCAAASVNVISDIVYGQGYVAPEPGASEPRLFNLRGDLYLPDESVAGLRPAAVFVHGGSFNSGDKTADCASETVRLLSENGYVCFSIDYRLMPDDPLAPPPYDATLPLAALHAAFTDTKTAIRFLRANHERYRIDPERVAALGDSAGAFAAIAAGVADPQDFSDDGPNRPVPAANNPQENGKANAVVDFWGSAEPVIAKLDPKDPPILIVHGTKDTHIGVFFPTALKLKAACEKNGVPYRFCPLEGKGHGHDAWHARYEDKDMPTLALEFLNEFMKAPARSNASAALTP
jgi:predicted esterase